MMKRAQSVAQNKGSFTLNFAHSGPILWDVQWDAFLATNRLIDDVDSRLSAWRLVASWEP